MFSISSPLALTGQLKFDNTTTILLVIFLLTLNDTSCEARHLRDHGDHSSNLPSSLSPRDVREVDATEKMMRPSIVVRFWSNFDASQRNDKVTAPDGKTKAVASSGASCDSLTTRFQGIKARSGLRERSVLGADTKSEQHVVSNATTTYTAETLVVMDYLQAHPAPAVHNK